jgi:hypothetical protein
MDHRYGRREGQVEPHGLLGLWLRINTPSPHRESLLEEVRAVVKRDVSYEITLINTINKLFPRRAPYWPAGGAERSPVRSPKRWGRRQHRSRTVSDEGANS